MVVGLLLLLLTLAVIAPLAFLPLIPRPDLPAPREVDWPAAARSLSPAEGVRERAA